MKRFHWTPAWEALLREWQAHHDATLKHLYSLIAEGRKRWEAEQ